LERKRIFGLSTAEKERLSRRERPTLGFLLSWFGEAYTQTIFAAAVETARQQDTNLILFEAGRVTSPFEDSQYQVLCDLASPIRLDGLVVFTEGMDQFVEPPDMVCFLRTRYPEGMPLTSIGAVEGFPSVVADLKSGMVEVIDHLIEVHGCQQIAFIHGPQSQTAAVSLFEGYRLSLEKHGLPFDPSLVTPPGVWGQELGASAVHVLLDERKVNFQAIAGGDPEALGAMAELQRRGFRIPYDVAVVGYNDLDLSRFSTPPLTTVHRPVAETAQRAIQMLLEKLLDGLGENPAPEQLTLPTRAVLRRSCGCVPELVRNASTKVDSRTGGKDFHQAFTACKAQILEAVRQSAPEMWAASPPDRLVTLLDTFAREASGQTEGEFLLELEESLYRAKPTGDFLETWQETLSTLRSSLLPCFSGDRPAWQRGENLWQQGRVLIASQAAQQKTYEQARKQQDESLLREVSRALIATFEVTDLMDVLARELPRLGIPSCYLSLYEDPDQPAGQARLVLAYCDGQRAALPPHGPVFPARLLVPEEYLPQERQWVMLAEPLFFKSQPLGFVLFEVGPPEGEVYSALRGQISSALQGALLARRNIELYNEAVQARKSAEVANLLKSRFLNMVSHELRTPISLIAGLINMLEEPKREPRDPKQFQRDVEAIRASAQHLSHLIGDVLDLASSQAGELRLTFAPLDFRAVLAEVRLLAQPMAAEKGLAWKDDLPDELPLVYGDRTRLRQVVLNLVSNAIKFTHSGSVTMSVELRKHELTVRVTDTGIGIPPDEQELIFDEFRQSERTAQRGYGGIGLGLAISRRLVEMHGGRIGVHSSGEESSGSEFYFTLPVMDRPAQGLKPVSEGSRPVLLLTKDTGQAKSMREFLARGGFEVEELLVRDSPGWLEEAVAASPGALVLDYEPAAERGWELVQLLRENPETQDIPVLFYSFLADQKSGSFLELDYLTKPVGSAELARAMERFGIHQENCRTIMLVEDDPCLLDLHSRLVEERIPNCRLMKAANGRAALELMSQEQPDLVLLDLMMPEVDGFQVLESMRSHELTRSIPVIVLTGQVLDSVALERLRSGVVAVLGKGLFSAEEVLAQVEAALDRSKRMGSEAQRVVRRAMAYIHEHFAEDISRDDLARFCGVNERYLTRCFRQETGLTPIVYLNRFRIRQAKILLESGCTNVTEVALQVGFSDSSYFGRVFREEVGISPGAYQRGKHK
jgi:signal transduction histidine kinase/DNA-binding LacI/PurR family transcriptional regulator/CheY-like chemotaxis protein